MTDIIFYLLTGIIGIALGCLGSGGSILLVPLMVYMLQMDAVTASGNSMIVVGIASLVIAFTTYKYQKSDKDILLWFGNASMVSIIIMRGYILHLIPEIIIYSEALVLTKQKMIMLLFAIVMAIVARSMIKSNTNLSGEKEEIKKKHPVILIFLGLVVGLLSGLLGIGGGFIIIPILIVWFRFEVAHAISLSIVLIAGNAIIGFLSGLKHLKPDYELLIGMTVICLAGMIVGVNIRNMIDSNKLKVAFGYFILLIGAFIIVKEYF